MHSGIFYHEDVHVHRKGVCDVSERMSSSFIIFSGSQLTCPCDECSISHLIGCGLLPPIPAIECEDGKEPDAKALHEHNQKHQQELVITETIERILPDDMPPDFDAEVMTHKLYL